MWSENSACSKSRKNPRSETSTSSTPSTRRAHWVSLKPLTLLQIVAIRQSLFGPAAWACEQTVPAAKVPAVAAGKSRRRSAALAIANPVRQRLVARSFGGKFTSPPGVS